MGIFGSYIAVGSQVARGAGAALVTSTTLLADATTITFTGLDLEADYRYMIRVFWKAPAVDASIRLYYNNDSTNANYKYQRCILNGAAGFANASDAFIMTCNSNNNAYGEINIQKTAGNQPLANCIESNYDTGATKQATNIYSHYWTTTTNVSRIDLTCDSVSGIKTGSIIAIYRM